MSSNLTRSTKTFHRLAVFPPVENMVTGVQKTTAVGMSHTEKSMTAPHIEIPQSEIAKLCQRNGIRKLALFGSVLTDRFSDSSDIDVLVEFQPHE